MFPTLLKVVNTPSLDKQIIVGIRNKTAAKINNFFFFFNGNDIYTYNVTSLHKLNKAWFLKRGEKLKS